MGLRPGFPMAWLAYTYRRHRPSLSERLSSGGACVGPDADHVDYGSLLFAEPWDKDRSWPGHVVSPCVLSHSVGMGSGVSVVCLLAHRLMYICA